jgi:hypothetical protein
VDGAPYGISSAFRVYVEEEDRVVVATIQDGRAAAAATAS